jgi:DNA-binding transcriptional ArsR family regulator
MVKYSEPLDATFGALADGTRRAILARLALGETSVTELARPFAMSLPAVSKHLRVLEHAGLLTREKDGRVHRCHIEAAPMKSAAAWIARYREFWEERLSALERYLKESEPRSSSPASPRALERRDPQKRSPRSKTEGLRNRRRSK